MKTQTTYVFLAILATTSMLVAQLDEQEVRQRLELIHSGKIEQVRTEVASLLKQLPNDPGLKYLDAYMTENGDQAVKKYQWFVDNFPQNEWADDALYKVYQYYYAVGLYKTADAKLKQLNEQYPNSIFATKNGNEVVTPGTPPTDDSRQQPSAEQSIGEVKREIVTTPSAAEGYVVQIAVYSQEAKAQQQANDVAAVVGRQAIVFVKQSGGKTVYAVGFEGFADEQSAKAYGGELKSKFNLDWFLVKR